MTQVENRVIFRCVVSKGLSLIQLETCSTLLVYKKNKRKMFKFVIVGIESLQFIKNHKQFLARISRTSLSEVFQKELK